MGDYMVPYHKVLARQAFLTRKQARLHRFEEMVLQNLEK